jgi:hypothetical protein
MLLKSLTSLVCTPFASGTGTHIISEALYLLAIALSKVPLVFCNIADFSILIVRTFNVIVRKDPYFRNHIGWG